MRKVGIIVGCGAAGIMAALLTLTTPTAIGPFGTLVFFVCFYVAVVCVLSVLFLTLQRWWQRLRHIDELQRTTAMSALKLYYFASVLALAPVMLLGMQAVGGIELEGVGLVLLFEAVGCFYINKRF